MRILKKSLLHRSLRSKSLVVVESLSSIQATGTHLQNEMNDANAYEDDEDE